MTDAQLTRASLVCTKAVLDALLTNGSWAIAKIIKAHMKRLASKNGRRKWG